MKEEIIDFRQTFAKGEFAPLAFTPATKKQRLLQLLLNYLRKHVPEFNTAVKNRCIKRQSLKLENKAEKHLDCLSRQSKFINTCIRSFQIWCVRFKAKAMHLHIMCKGFSSCWCFKKSTFVPRIYEHLFVKFDIFHYDTISSSYPWQLLLLFVLLRLASLGLASNCWFLVHCALWGLGKNYLFWLPVWRTVQIFHFFTLCTLCNILMFPPSDKIICNFTGSTFALHLLYASIYL